MARVWIPSLLRDLTGGRESVTVSGTLLPSGGTLIDIGCGTGGVLVSAQGRYRAIYGVDVALRRAT
jgi:precorrin-6B methylase 2